MCTGYYGSGMGPMSDVPSFISKFVCMCRFCRKTRLSLSLFSALPSLPLLHPNLPPSNQTFPQYSLPFPPHSPSPWRRLLQHNF